LHDAYLTTEKIQFIATSKKNIFIALINNQLFVNAFSIRNEMYAHLFI